MVHNWTGSDHRRRWCREARILAFLLWGHHAERVEGGTHRYSPLGLSNGTDRFQVPTEHVDHPNGVAEVDYLTVLIHQKDLDGFERQLTSVIGFTPQVGPDGTRTWSLSVTAGSHSPRLIIRTPRDREEEVYVREREGSIYNLAFRSAHLGGAPLTI